MFGANEDILYWQKETMDGYVGIGGWGRQEWGARGRLGSEPWCFEVWAERMYVFKRQSGNYGTVVFSCSFCLHVRKGLWSGCMDVALNLRMWQSLCVSESDACLYYAGCPSGRSCSNRKPTAFKVKVVGLDSLCIHIWDKLIDTALSIRMKRHT